MMQKESSVQRKQPASSPYLQKAIKFIPVADFDWKKKASKHNQSMIVDGYEGVDFRSIQNIKALANPPKLVFDVLLSCSLIMNSEFFIHKKPFTDQEFWWKACQLTVKDPKKFIKMMKNSEKNCKQNEESYDRIAAFVKDHISSFDNNRAQSVCKCMGPIACWVVKILNNYETTNGKELTSA